MENNYKYDESNLRQEERKEQSVSSNPSNIININDYIFKQNLEFYPNLSSITCEDNNLIYKENGEVISSVALSFDLRTLPNEVWTIEPAEFINIIKLNKDCLSLIDMADYINEHLRDTQFSDSFNGTHLNGIKKFTKRYYEGVNNKNLLCEAANLSLGYFATNIMGPYEDGVMENGPIKESMDNAKKEYTLEHPESKTKSLERTLTNFPITTTPEEKSIVPVKAGFINLAILIYGLINIGVILAIAIMK